MHINLPPLRERTDEIKELAISFMKKYAEKYRRSVTQIDGNTLSALKLYRWSGNIRELKNSIEKAVIMSEGDILTLQDMQFSIPIAPSFVEGMTDAIQGRNASAGAKSQDYNGETLEMQEERTIRAAMERCGGNLSLVAKTLNISRPTLYSKLKKYGI